MNADLQFLNDCCHLRVIGHLAIAITVLLDTEDSQARDVAAEDTGDENACTHFLLVHPLDLEHAPVGLNSDSSESLFLTFPFRFTKASNKSISKMIRYRVQFL